MARQPIYDNARNRTVHDTAAERDRGYGAIRSLGGNSATVEVFWDLNDEAKRDQVLKLRIGDKTALVQVEQLYKYMRWC